MTDTTRQIGELAQAAADQMTGGDYEWIYGAGMVEQGVYVHGREGRVDVTWSETAMAATVKSALYRRTVRSPRPDSTFVRDLVTGLRALGFTVTTTT